MTTTPAPCPADPQPDPWAKGPYIRETAARLAAEVLARTTTPSTSAEDAGRAVVRAAQHIEAYLRGQQ